MKSKLAAKPRQNANFFPLGADTPAALPIFAALFRNTQSDKMENIQNTRSKGYCILYLLMFLFFITSLVLMLYFRSSVLEWK